MHTVTRSTIELAPLSVGAGFAKATRWLLLFPRAWYRGWLAYARATGSEPEHLIGPSPWLARNEIARRTAAEEELRGVTTSRSAAGRRPGVEPENASSEDDSAPDDAGGRVIRGVFGDGEWTRRANVLVRRADGRVAEARNP